MSKKVKSVLELKFNAYSCSKNSKQDIIRTYLFSPKEGHYLECDIKTIGELQEENQVR